MPAGELPPRRRRPRPAVQPWEHRGALYAAYLRLYSADPDFRSALVRLYAAHCAGHELWVSGLLDLSQVRVFAWCHTVGQTSPPVEGRPSPEVAEWASNYLSAVAELAKRWGLDRLHDVPASRDVSRRLGGEALIHDWCSLAAGLALLPGHPAPDPERFGWVSWGGPRPDVGEVIERDKIPQTTKDGRKMVLEREYRAPLLRFPTGEVWDPRTETMAEARQRLLPLLEAHLDAELERIARDAERRGYVFHDTTPMVGRHLRWLFARIALHEQYPAIAKRDLGSPGLAKTVQNAVIRIAAQIGVDMPHRV
jgi:hypothetical protein